GLMLGAVLAPAHAGRAGALLELAADEGLLLLQAGPDGVRLVPPLNITGAEVADGRERLGRALDRAGYTAPRESSCGRARPHLRQCQASASWSGSPHSLQRTWRRRGCRERANSAV